MRSSPTSASLVALGERYVALGLPAAARGAFERAFELGDGAIAARKLAELAITADDGAAARRFAQVVVDAEKNAAARLLLARAQLCAGELDAARFSFSTVLNSASTRALRARAHLGRSSLALLERDEAGAAAHAMAGLDELFALAAEPGRPATELEAELALIEELIARAVSLSRATDVKDAIDQLRERRRDAPCELLVALLIAARQLHGDDTASDADIEAALAAQLTAYPDSTASLIYSAERRLRRRHRDPAAREAAIASLEAVSERLPPSDTLQRARVQFLLAAAHEDDPGELEQAERAYREGLRLRPGHVAAANRLARLGLSRGDIDAALAEVERALRLDASHGLVWRNAARVVDASSRGAELKQVMARLLDAAEPGAGVSAGVVPHLIAAAAEIARGDVLAGMHARGHRLKNLLGIIGSRTRSARKLTPTDAAGGELVRRLQDLEREVMELYDEWSSYLRSMQTDGTVVESISVAALVNDVVRAVCESSATPVRVSVVGPLPELRGDRMLLREALLNIVANAAEACVTNGGSVDVRARSMVTGAGRTPMIEIEVADTGPGIRRENLSRVFAPGFTTKETGSGIGLAVADRVISAHHGRILLDSKIDRGTQVVLLLPTDLGGFATLAALPSESRATEVE